MKNLFPTELIGYKHLLFECRVFIKQREGNTASSILVYIEFVIFIFSNITVQDDNLDTFLGILKEQVKR